MSRSWTTSRLVSAFRVPRTSLSYPIAWLGLSRQFLRTGGAEVAFLPHLILSVHHLGSIRHEPVPVSLTCSVSVLTAYPDLTAYCQYYCIRYAKVKFIHGARVSSTSCLVDMPQNGRSDRMWEQFSSLVEHNYHRINITHLDPSFVSSYVLRTFESRPRYGMTS